MRIHLINTLQVCKQTAAFAYHTERSRSFQVVFWNCYLRSNILRKRMPFLLLCLSNCLVSKVLLRCSTYVSEKFLLPSSLQMFVKVKLHAFINFSKNIASKKQQVFVYMLFVMLVNIQHVTTPHVWTLFKTLSRDSVKLPAFTAPTLWPFYFISHHRKIICHA